MFGLSGNVGDSQHSDITIERREMEGGGGFDDRASGNGCRTGGRAGSPCKMQGRA